MGRKHNPETQLYKPWDKSLCPAISWFCLSWHLCSLKGESHGQGCTGQVFALHASWELGRPLMAEAHGHPFRSPMDNCTFKPKKKKSKLSDQYKCPIPTCFIDTTLSLRTRPCQISYRGLLFVQRIARHVSTATVNVNIQLQSSFTDWRLYATEKNSNHN